MSKRTKPMRAAMLLCLAGLAFLWSMVISIGYLQIVYLPRTDYSQFSFAVAFVVACSAFLMLLAAGRFPAFLYSGRSLLGIGVAAVAFGMLLLSVALADDSANALLLAMAALLLGFAVACGYVLWADACTGLSGFAFSTVLLGSFLAAFAIQFACGVSSWACWAVGLGSGVLSFLTRLAIPFLKSIARMHGFFFAVDRKEPFVRLSLTSFLLACVWGYSIHHFATHMERVNAPVALSACIVGAGVCLGATAAVHTLSKGKTSSGFAILKALPIVMVFSFVPLEYLEALSSNFQVELMIASGAILVPLLIIISHDCARLLSLKPIATDVFVLVSAMTGSVVGSTINVFVGSNTSSVVWAIAPAVCLIVGIGACEFLLKRTSIARYAIRYAEERGEQDALTENMGVLKEHCVAAARKHDLTARELDVLYMLVQGYSVSRVSEVLHIAEGTATTHKRHIYKKLDVHTKNELIDLIKSNESG